MTRCVWNPDSNQDRHKNDAFSLSATLPTWRRSLRVILLKTEKPARRRFGF